MKAMAAGVEGPEPAISQMRRGTTRREDLLAALRQVA